MKSRYWIGVASREHARTGILMQRLNLSEDDAHHLLHRRSRHLRKAVREVARDILETDQAIRRQTVPK